MSSGVQAANQVIRCRVLWQGDDCCGDVGGGVGLVVVRRVARRRADGVQTGARVAVRGADRREPNLPDVVQLFLTRVQRRSRRLQNKSEKRTGSF